ncbi:diguanylate cyclase [Rhodobacteraceae bacterium GS-10]|uniref:diguanylate cyclase n=2 Tax=Thalassovita mangrovi TaxID=2692236 RepID=A0A6L8LFD3_9RHOB|nr:diguanylate cyclase [Thalassovita mangrovi]MYM54761.1 diguanylate cyclase [Thalassovita mangrovi]
MRLKLASAYYDVVQASSGGEALAILDREDPDLVMVSGPLPDMSCESFCKVIRATETGRDRPLLLMLPRADRPTLISALRCGADQVLPATVSDQLLFSQLRALIRGQYSSEQAFLRDNSSPAFGFGEPTAPFLSGLKIAIVADDRSLARRWQSDLHLPDQFRLSNHTPRSLIRDIETQGNPDILMVGVDGQTPDCGLSLLAGFCANTRKRRSMVLAVITNGDDALAAEALDLGANDVLVNGFSAAEAEETMLRLTRLARRKHLADSLHSTLRKGLRDAMIDPLTGLYNRRYAFPYLQKMIEEAATGAAPLAVMVADLDHFKRINDQHGHVAGDDILRRVTNRMSACLPAGALLARLGGEEFLIAIPSMSDSEARLTARRLCDAIGDVPFTLPGAAAPIPVTISIGLSLGGGVNAQRPANAQQLMEQADRALYRAKSDGRNQVMFSRPAA